KKNEFVRPREKLASIQTVTKGSTAERMKLAVGDSIVAVNGRPTIFLDQFTNELKNSANKTASITVIRNGQSMDFSGTIDSTATIGVSLAVVDLPITTKHFGFWEALPIGTTKAVSVVTDNIRGFGKIFKGDVRADKALSGPVGIAKMFGTEVNWVKFWSLVGMLSMALAFMNLLPIPALDGGHVIFLLVEMIQGKPLSDNFLEKAQMVGFFILIALMLFTLGNDIIKW